MAPMASYHGTQQWHHVQSAKVCHNHPPPIASSNPSNGTLPHGTLTPSNGTLPWHPAMTPYQMAPINGIQQWRQQWHPTTCNPAMAPYHGTLPWHPAMAPYHGIQQWHHVQSVKVFHNHPAKVGSQPPLLFRVAENRIADNSVLECRVARVEQLQ